MRDGLIILSQDEKQGKQNRGCRFHKNPADLGDNDGPHPFRVYRP
jgi:hypothetical protein